MQEKPMTNDQIAALERKVGDQNVVNLLRAYVKQLRLETSNLDHQMEHTLANVEDGLKVAIEKIRDAEKDDSERLQKLVSFKFLSFASS